MLGQISGVSSPPQNYEKSLYQYVYKPFIFEVQRNNALT